MKLKNEKHEMSALTKYLLLLKVGVIGFTYMHWRRSALNSAGAFPENFGEFSPIQHFII